MTLPWFLSIGYGFSVAGLGAAILIAALAGGFSINAVTVLQCALFIAYGVRLSGFLLARELKNADYRKVLTEVSGATGKPMPFFVKPAIWISVAVLYVAQTAPVFFAPIMGRETTC